MRHRIRSIAVLAVLAAAAPALAGDLISVGQGTGDLEATDEAALVYVVRPAFLGKAVKSWAFVDEQPIGANKGQHFTAALVPPGRHVFWAKAENVSAVELEIEAGRTYYLKQKISMGAMKARVRLVVLDEEAGRHAIEKCRYTTLTPDGVERAKEIIAAKYGSALNKAGRSGE